MDRIGLNNLGIVSPRHTTGGFVLRKFSISVGCDGPYLRSHRPRLEQLDLTDPALGTSGGFVLRKYSIASFSLLFDRLHIGDWISPSPGGHPGSHRARRTMK